MKYSYIETRSHCINKSFITNCWTDNAEFCQKIGFVVSGGTFHNQFQPVIYGQFNFRRVERRPGRRFQRSLLG
jgi:hypothetical protein